MRDHAFELHQRRKLELQLRVAPVSRCASVARTGTPRAAPLVLLSSAAACLVNIARRFAVDVGECHAVQFAPPRKALLRLTYGPADWAPHRACILFRAPPLTQHQHDSQHASHGFWYVRHVCTISRGDFVDDPQRAIAQFHGRDGRPATR